MAYSNLYSHIRMCCMRAVKFNVIFEDYSKLYIPVQNGSVHCLPLVQYIYLGQVTISLCNLLGNCGSAFIEILVGNSMWSQDKPYVTLLPSAMLMSPNECKHWMKTHTVRMFNQSMYFNILSSALQFVINDKTLITL